MPKGTKKEKASKRRQIEIQSAKADFTVYDFASIKSGREKKGVANAMTSQMKELSGTAQKREDSLAWFEKDLSDFELSEDEQSNCLKENEESSEVDKEKPAAKDVRRRRKKKTSHNEDDLGEMSYPLDVWFHIAQHIKPESVGKFALICQGSHMVTHTAQFWTNLYLRHMKEGDSLPDKLRRECRDKIHGLASLVIRSLFFTYQPFRERTRSITSFENDPDRLLGMRCVLMWYKRVLDRWHYFFKFHKEYSSSCNLGRNTSLNYRQRDNLLNSSDVHYNREESCNVLEIVALSFFSLPPVMGQYLTHASVSVGHRMRFHKLKLGFSPCVMHMRLGKGSAPASSTLLTLEPVLNMHALHWWDPRYPNSSNQLTNSSEPC